MRQKYCFTGSKATTKRADFYQFICAVIGDRKPFISLGVLFLLHSHPHPNPLHPYPHPHFSNCIAILTVSFPFWFSFRNNKKRTKKHTKLAIRYESQRESRQKSLCLRTTGNDSAGKRASRAAWCIVGWVLRGQWRLEDNGVGREATQWRCRLTFLRWNKGCRGAAREAGLQRIELDSHRHPPPPPPPPTPSPPPPTPHLGENFKLKGMGWQTEQTELLYFYFRSLVLGCTGFIIRQFSPPVSWKG